MGRGAPKGLSGQWDIDRIIAECRARGARCELDGGKWKVYPPDRDQRPLSISALAGHMGHGRDQMNLVRDLRKAGIDLTQDPPAPAEQTARPAPVPQPREDITMADQTTNGVALHPAVAADVTARPFDYRQAYKDLLKQHRMLSEATTAMLAELEGRMDSWSQEADNRIRALANRVRAMEQAQERGGAGQASGVPHVPTKTERITELVLGVFRSMPGFKMSPMTVEANILEKLDAIDAEAKSLRSKTYVAGICRDLAKRGVLQGGGTRAPGAPNSGPQNANHGLYWVEKPAPESTEPAETESQ